MKFVTSPDIDIAAAGGPSNILYTRAHNLGTTPDIMQWYAVNYTGEFGYQTGDMVDVSTAITFDGTHYLPITTYKNNTGVALVWTINNGFQVYQPSGAIGTYVGLSLSSKWRFRCYASLFK